MSRNFAASATTMSTTTTGNMTVVTYSTTASSTTSVTAPTSPFNLASIISAAVLYASVAIGFIWTGIGSIQARRWVRPIVLVFGTIWMSLGCLGALALVVAVPTMARAMQSSMSSAGPAMPAGFAIGITTFTILFSLVFYVGLPALLVWYYRSIDIARTLELHDPHPRWTDGVPLPVLGMSIASGLIAATFLFSTAGRLALLFGVMVTGKTAVLMLLVGAVFFASASFLIFRRRMLGWHLAVWGLVVSASSTLITTMLIDPLEMGREMKLSQQQLDLMKESLAARPVVTVGMGLIGSTAAIIFAMRARKYFQPAYQEIESPTETTPP
jgi:hypothetical protein